MFQQYEFQVLIYTPILLIVIRQYLQIYLTYLNNLTADSIHIRLLNSDQNCNSPIEICNLFYIDALEFSNTTTIEESRNSNKTLLKITDILGRTTEDATNTPLFYIYDDGTVEKRITIK